MTAAEFRAARHSLKLTQPAWAERLGVSLAHLKRIEGGGTPVTPTLAILVGLIVEKEKTNAG